MLVFLEKKKYRKFIRDVYNIKNQWETTDLKFFRYIYKKVYYKPILKLFCLLFYYWLIGRDNKKFETTKNML